MRYGHSTLNKLKVMSKTMDVQPPKNDDTKPKQRRKEVLVDDNEGKRERDEELRQEELRIKKSKKD